MRLSLLYFWGCCFCLVHTSFCADKDEHFWKELKGRHFVVRYEDDVSLARRVLHAAEGYYKAILDDLGFRRSDNFWLWENRAKITIYKDKHDFVSATGSPAWAAGKANYSNREIETFGSSDVFLKSRLPHELTHLIFRDFIGFDGEVPLWLDEGVAQWEEKEGRDLKLSQVRKLQKTGSLIPLETFTDMDIRQVKSSARVQAFYAQAVSVVGYLITVGGKSKFTRLCRQLRDGKQLNEALRFTYPRTTRSIQALQVAWLLWLQEK